MPKVFEVLKLPAVCKNNLLVAGSRRTGFARKQQSYLSGSGSKINCRHKLPSADCRMKQRMAMFERPSYSKASLEYGAESLMIRT